jgi:hypothetical protein
MRALVLLLLMTTAAGAQETPKGPKAECLAGNSVPKWLTVHSPNGRAVRVQLQPCDKDGNPSKDKDIFLKFNREVQAALPECKRYSDKLARVYIKEPGESAFKPTDQKACLER